MRWALFVEVVEIADDFSSHAQVAVKRAKEQLKSAMMMNLESRIIIFEDIGRHVAQATHYHIPIVP